MCTHFASAVSSSLLVMLATLAGGCSSSSSTGDDTATTDAGASAKPCKTAQEGVAAPASWQCVKTVDVTLVDTTSAPLSGVTVTACGRNICNYAKSDAAGKVHFDVFQYMDHPALKVPAEVPWVQFAWALPADREVHDLGTIKLVAQPATGTPIADNGGKPTTADATVTNGDVSLGLPKGTTITIDTLTLETPDQQAFRGLVVPQADAPPSVDPSLGLEMLVSLTPLDTLISPPASLTVPNGSGWAAGTKVELFLHGIDLTDQAVAPYGGWLAIGTGAVAADGKSIATDTGSGNGVPELSLVGLRRKK